MRLSREVLNRMSGHLNGEVACVGELIVQSASHAFYGPARSPWHVHVSQNQPVRSSLDIERGLRCCRSLTAALEAQTVIPRHLSRALLPPPIARPSEHGRRIPPLVHQVVAGDREQVSRVRRLRACSQPSTYVLSRVSMRYIRMGSYCVAFGGVFSSIILSSLIGGSGEVWCL